MLNDSISLPSWVYRIDSLRRRTIWPNTQNEVTALLENKKTRDTPNHRTYFPTPGEFLDTWIEWYRKWDSLFWNTIYDAMGFEMQYVDTDPESKFFKIWEHAWLNDIESRGVKVLNPIMLCADANEICDQDGYMNLWVNDMRDQSVKVYRWRGKYNTDIPYNIVGKEVFKKKLRKNKSYYLYDSPEKFPFESVNLLKSWGNIWHMIGFSPLSVYEKLKELGFTFDTKK